MLLKNIIRGLLREAAMDDGAAGGGPADATQGRQQPGAEKRSVHERLKSFLFAPQDSATSGEDADDGEGELPAKQTKKPSEAAKPPKVTSTTNDDDDDGSAEEDSQTDDDEITSVAELAERTGLSLDRILDLSHSLKSGDKETKTSIRDMLRSYQTSELLNTKLQTHASEVAAWKTQQQQDQQSYQQNLQRMDAGLQVAQRMLQGEFAQVDWAQLQQSDPAEFAQHHLAFQQRQAQLDQIAQQLGKERQGMQATQAEQQKASLAEQRQLLEAKLPEWSDEKTRKAALTEIAEVVGKAYGFDATHLAQLTDHRDFLVLNDALKWQKLQASKAGVMNKVRTAPKLLRPGSSQSAESKRGLAITEAKAKVRKSGNVRDAAKALIAGGFV